MKMIIFQSTTKKKYLSSIIFFLKIIGVNKKNKKKGKYKKNKIFQKKIKGKKKKNGKPKKL